MVQLKSQRYRGFDFIKNRRHKQHELKNKQDYYFFSFLSLLVLSGDLDDEQSRSPNRRRTRMVWEDQLAKLWDDEFRRCYRVDKTLFHEILAEIKEDITCKHPSMVRNRVIQPELKLSMALRYLAGGSYFDIYLHHGVSKSIFFECVWETIQAIDTHYNMSFPLDDPSALEKLEQGLFYFIHTLFYV